MQYKDKKTLQLRKAIGKTFYNLRLKANKSRRQTEGEYDLSSGSLTRVENGTVDAKVITAWRISESLGIKLSDVIKTVENELGADFTLNDE